MQWQDHISVDSATMGGEPCVKGARVPVIMIMGNLAKGCTRLNRS